jgi:hypothetical protein
MFRKLFPALIILLGVAGIATARNCHQFFAAPVVQQVVAVPQVYYSVGQDLQTEALAEKVADLVEKKLAIRAAIKAEPVVSPSSALAQNCAKCHSGPSAKAGLVYDGSPLKCSDITKALRAIASGKMPKGPQIDGATKGELMQELLDLEAKPAVTPPAPAPDSGLE